MITVVIMLILLVGIYSGARRGLLLQLLHMAGYFISFILAMNYYEWLAGKIDLFVPYPSFTPGTTFALFSDSQALNLDGAFYNGVAFVLLVMVGWIITRIIGYMLTEISYIPVVKQVNQLGGAALGFIFNYIGIFLILFILSMVPTERIQVIFEGNTLAHHIVEDTPLLTKKVTHWWVDDAVEDDRK
ncbi:Uncharacterized membrane protein, required for colicin V production [Granulicatella balaenopterae]|uniref:Uncharacterized membrane protein, required for colicin V production n=1 Tax=Granulicatella balaenopterae TaxID=137733 RepID=A0A1H9N9B8_9LACT|nr:CvpA family protein [Granulicatella balaenopterae]SER32269.1 Uncharacterized membrane protein, required for colicin V production [Granulicatella balaenopterae]